MSLFKQLLPQFNPRHYDLSLDLDEAGHTFTGRVIIYGTSTLDGTITLHTKQLDIQKVTLGDKPAKFTLGKFDELTITSSAIQAGTEATIAIKFSAAITDAMHGMYPCYFTEDGVKKELFATQFESHHAREVFPCIDEPAAKATFDFTITHDASTTALSNMPVHSQEVLGTRQTTSFDTTPRMSTYLLAWVTGDLQNISAKTSRGVDVSIWSTKAQDIKDLEFALSIATRTIDFYEEYFDVPYPLPKSDHIALPDFGSGAMENWGLITYRETALLASDSSSIESRRRVATVVAHELAHQWFGNLVTMQWWDDLWLNESFATMMEYVAVDTLYPEWEMWMEFTAGETIYSARRDVIDGVQSVHVDVKHPDEIASLFDPAIVYAKGAKLIKMLRAYVGDEAFRNGLHDYFVAHAYQNTVGDDLWAALERASDKPVRSVMQTWIGQPGIPVVHVTRVGDEYTLSQERLFVGPHESSDQLWPIPLDATSSVPTMFDEKSLTFTSTQPVAFNTGDTGHFITHYESSILDDRLGRIANGSLSTLQRFQLISEVSLLIRAGIMHSSSLLDILPYYAEETNHFVWDAMSIIFGELKKFTDSSEDAEKSLRQLAYTVAHGQYKLLGWDKNPGETEQTSNLRLTILGLMSFSEDPAVIDTALSIASHDLDTIDPDIRDIVLSVAVKYGEDTLRHQLIELHASTQNAELRDDIASGLTSAKDPEFIKLLLENMKNPEHVRLQDLSHWFAYLMRSRYARDQTWTWMVDNWQWIQKQFVGDKSYDEFPRYSSQAIYTHDLFDAYQEFFTPLASDPSLTRAITMGIREIEGKLELVDRDTPGVIARLAEL